MISYPEDTKSSLQIPAVDVYQGIDAVKVAGYHTQTRTDGVPSVELPQYVPHAAYRESRTPSTTRFSPPHPARKDLESSQEGSRAKMHPFLKGILVLLLLPFLSVLVALAAGLAVVYAGGKLIEGIGRCFSVGPEKLWKKYSPAVKDLL